MDPGTRAIERQFLKRPLALCVYKITCTTQLAFWRNIEASVCALCDDRFYVYSLEDKEIQAEISTDWNLGDAGSPCFFSWQTRWLSKYAWWKDMIETRLTRKIQFDIVANSIDARESRYLSRTDIYSPCSANIARKTFLGFFSDQSNSSDNDNSRLIDHCDAINTFVMYDWSPWRTE